MREIVAHGSTAVKVDGPYGEPTESVSTSNTPLLLVAGGIGVRLQSLLTVYAWPHAGHKVQRQSMQDPADRVCSQQCTI